MDLEEAELAAVGQAINFAIGIGARDIILEGDLASFCNWNRCKRYHLGGRFSKYFLTSCDLRKKIIHAGCCGGGSNIKNESVQTMEGKAVLGERRISMRIYWCDLLID